MCTRLLAKLLDTELSSKVNMQVSTLNAKTNETAYKIDLDVCGIQGGQTFGLRILIYVSQVARRNNPISTEYAKLTDIPRLRELDFPFIKDDKIDLLIGIMNEELLDIVEVRCSPEYCIAATLSKFGWLLVGHTGKRYEEESISAKNELAYELIHLHT